MSNVTYVVITADTSRFQAALAEAAACVSAVVPLLRRAQLAQQRRRSRLVTHRKQRRRW